MFDRSNSIYSLYIPFEMINNVSRFVSGQLKVEPEIPEEFRNRIAKCYHSFNLLKEAYKLTSNHDHKFDLALALGYTRDGTFLDNFSLQDRNYEQYEPENKAYRRLISEKGRDRAGH
jgi:hypothetical protein